MREDYKLKGSTVNVQVQIETDAADSLKKMSDYTKLTTSEIVNTAVKRFIVTHKDFFPDPRAAKK